MFLSPLTVFLLDLNLESPYVVPIRYLSEAYLLDRAGALFGPIGSVNGGLQFFGECSSSRYYLLLIVSVNGFHTTQIIQWFY